MSDATSQVIRRVAYWDNDGFIALTDVEGYAGFVGGDWTMDSISEHFTHEMQAGHLAIMAMKQEDAIGRFEFRTVASDAAAEHEHTFPLDVVSGRLHFVTYGALTMVAQFENEKLADQGYELEDAGEFENGTYAVTFRYLPHTGDVDPENEETFPVVEVVMERDREVDAPAEFPGRDLLR